MLNWLRTKPMVNGYGVNMKDYNIDINDATKCFKEYGISVKKGTGKITLEGKDICLSEMLESQLMEAKQRMSVT